MSAWEQVFQKIGHLLHIVCPMNADGPQLRSLAERGTPSWSRKIWKAWALTGRSSSKHFFLLWCRCVQACNQQLVLDKFNSPPVAACSSLQHRNAECNFPGPKMTQGWHVSLAAKATPSQRCGRHELWQGDLFASFFCCSADALKLATGNSFLTSSVSNTTSCDMFNSPSQKCRM